MKINVITTGRFHLLDLARELHNSGYDVKLYTYVTPKRCETFGINKNAISCYLWIAAPFLLLRKLFPGIDFFNRLLVEVIDRFVANTMRNADVCIALGSVFNATLTKAKSKGEVYILEWGSKHIIEQLKMLNKTHSQWSIDKELFEYENADYIAIPANHVKNSFVKHGVPEEKLLVNPYGVSICDFKPTEFTGEYDIITVGGWRYEKGSDLLVELCLKYGYKLLHVGTIVNMEFPTEKNFKHYDSVNQSELGKFYRRAKIFALPSRAEGLSLVQAQAIACGLPIVCSKETGGEDLKKILNNTPFIKVMDELTVESLHYCVEEAIEMASNQKGLRNYVNDDITNLSWRAYGERYRQNLKRLTKEQ